jgi:hypothetical protein
MAARLRVPETQEEDGPGPMKIKSIWLRTIHKWVGLAIGLQFVLWAVSGAAMALLDMEAVAGGPRPEAIEAALPGEATGWSRIAGQLGAEKVQALRLGTLVDRPVTEVRTARSTQIFDARTGERVTITADLARAVARAAHPDRAIPVAVTLLTEGSGIVTDQGARAPDLAGRLRRQ